MDDTSRKTSRSLDGCHGLRQHDTRGPTETALTAIDQALLTGSPRDHGARRLPSCAHRALLGRRIAEMIDPRKEQREISLLTLTKGERLRRAEAASGEIIT